MDSLSQIVLGAAVGNEVLGKKLGNKSILYGAIIGTIPDLDLLYGKFVDPLTATDIHRGFSHSLLFFLFLSPILGWVLQKLEHKNNVNFKEATLFAYLVLQTHALLDFYHLGNTTSLAFGTTIFITINFCN
jgi:inner membrane protein